MADGEVKSLKEVAPPPWNQLKVPAVPRSSNKKSVFFLMCTFPNKKDGMISEMRIQDGIIVNRYWHGISHNMCIHKQYFDMIYDMSTYITVYDVCVCWFFVGPCPPDSDSG